MGERVMNGFRELNATEMAQVEGGGILSRLGSFFGGVVDDLRSAVNLAWQTLTSPFQPMT